VEVARERASEMNNMAHDWKEPENEEAAGANCPMPDCGALVLTYRSRDHRRGDKGGLWEFTCPRCGMNFAFADEELIFHSVPKSWLLAAVHAA